MPPRNKLQVLLVDPKATDSAALTRLLNGTANLRQVSRSINDAPVAPVTYSNEESLPLSRFHVVIGKASSPHVRNSMLPNALVFDSAADAIRQNHKLLAMTMSSGGCRAAPPAPAPACRNLPAALVPRSPG